MKYPKDAFGYAWRGSGGRWDNAWVQLLGCLVGGLLILISGIKVPTAILDNPALSGVAAIAIGALAGALIVFVARLCWWPVHQRVAGYGGLLSFLDKNLGALMWPMISIATGILLFALFCGGGLVWLMLQLRTGQGNFAVADSLTVNGSPNTVGNPDFILLGPEGRYRFKWDPMEKTQFDIRLDTERNPDFFNNPAFVVRNKTNTVAYNVTATWKSEIGANVAALTKAPRLAKYKFEVSETKMLIWPPEGSKSGGYQYYLSDSPKQILPVIAKEAEVYLPPDIWAVAALYLIDRMPSKIGETTEPFVVRIMLNWETSEGKRSRAYRVRITATNSKVSETDAPVADAFLNFSLEEIPQ